MAAYWWKKKADFSWKLWWSRGFESGAASAGGQSARSALRGSRWRRAWARHCQVAQQVTVAFHVVWWLCQRCGFGSGGVALAPSTMSIKFSILALQASAVFNVHRFCYLILIFNCCRVNLKPLFNWAPLDPPRSEATRRWQAKLVNIILSSYVDCTMLDKHNLHSEGVLSQTLFEEDVAEALIFCESHLITHYGIYSKLISLDFR